MLINGEPFTPCYVENGQLKPFASVLIGNQQGGLDIIWENPEAL